jgi:hypothetical protein
MACREVCHADRDGDCVWKGCPQIRDGYCDENGNPKIEARPFRSCPLPDPRDEDEDQGGPHG